MEREVGGGIGMGKTCKLKDVSFQCMTKFTTNKKKKKKKEKKSIKQTKKKKSYVLFRHFVKEQLRTALVPSLALMLSPKIILTNSTGKKDTLILFSFAFYYR